MFPSETGQGDAWNAWPPVINLRARRRFAFLARFKVQQRPRRERAERASHLLQRQRMLRMAGETRIMYLADLRMSLQKLGDP